MNNDVIVDTAVECVDNVGDGVDCRGLGRGRRMAEREKMKKKIVIYANDILCKG